MISNCGHDENNKYSGGTAGDQTGTEWALIAWYSRPWSCVLRHPDAAVRAKIAELATAAAKNDKIGYDQSQRLTFWTQLQAANYDPAKIATACEADCSSGVAAIVKAVGYLLGNTAMKNVSTSMVTSNERSALKSAGFEVLTASQYLTSADYLLAGDILLNDTYHTATNVTDGSKASSGSTSTSSTSGASSTTTTSTANTSSTSSTTLSAQLQYAQKKDSSLAGTYTTTAGLNLRYGPDSNKYASMVVMPQGIKCQCYGYYSLNGSTKWLYVEATVSGKKYTGFASADYLSKS